MSNRAIADFLGVSEYTVRKDIKDHEEGDQLRDKNAVAQTGEHDDFMSEQLRNYSAVAHPGVVPDEAAGGVDSQVSSASSGRLVSTPSGGRPARQPGGNLWSR